MRKKFLLALFLLSFQVLSAWCEELVIASWNIRHPVEYQDEFIKEACIVVEKNNIDLLALQEVNVNKGQFLERMLAALQDTTGELWGAFTSNVNQHINDTTIGDQTYSSFREDQNNVFLFRSKKITGKNLYQKFSFHKFAASEFKLDKNQVVVASFTDVITGNTFNLVNVHLPANNIEHRYRDNETVFRLFSKLSNKQGKIVMGDFNLHYNELKSKYTFVGVKEATSIRTKGGFANDYDHFAYNKVVENAVVSKPERVKSGGIYEIGSVEFREKISDHAPIIMTVDFAR